MTTSVGGRPERSSAWIGDSRRDPDEVAIGVIVHTAQTQDPTEIRALSRSMAAGFFEYSPALFSQAGFQWNGPDIEELQRRVIPDFHHAADLVESGKLVDFLSDDVARSFSFTGAPSDIAANLRNVLEHVPEAKIVVPHPIPTPRFGDSPKFVEWFTTEVLSVI